MGIIYSEPLCQACYDNESSKVYELIRADGRNIDVQDAVSGDTPLIAACRAGNLQVVKFLLDKGADASLRNKKKRTCLHYVAKRAFSYLDFLLIIILMPILLIGYIIMLETQKRNVKLMNLALSSNVDVDAVDYKGNTALHYTCQNKSHNLVPLLLARNVKTSIKNEKGETPLDVAKRLKFAKIIKELKKEG
ncbi:ankyrin repeat domain-containing protein 22 isoform X1 [Denticeps clupeoides]|uniref:Ankyrin repeat domain-containing protein 22 n=1 Tax=Denticeps clupeoides TaxID=299321 RepID=A0AAY4DB12_9TELE|nr:ankyrin repeat domain-containing protein 22 isoform X1 [Denticeps clupeoides]